MSISSKFAKFAVFNVIFTVFIILWGAVVRATGSGAGCEDHWPDCRGQLIPSQFDAPMAIEYTHRVTSGLFMLAIFGLGFWARKVAPKGAPVRMAAGVSVFLGLVECAIGAALVRLGLVEGNTSVERAVVLALHHCNTALLLGALTITAWFACGGAVPRLRQQGSVLTLLVLGAVGVLATIVSGAITALGDTLFPPESTIHTMQQALEPGAHFLERFRILHPPISIAASLFLVLALPLAVRLRHSAFANKLANLTIGMVLFQICLGFINVALKAPMWMQLTHLAVADAIWILFLCTGCSLLAIAAREGAAEEPVPVQMTAKETVKAYIALTKPRVISLLLFTTVAAMFIAAGGLPSLGLLFWVTIGGYLMAGAANAINMVIDSDIDLKMARTATRPTVTHVISPTSAMLFAIGTGTLSFIMLTLAANLLTAVLALAGLLFYVFIYTLLLKRRTWQNIVIGGAAGAFPPLVGYAAVSGELSVLAWFLFALIFFWTPVHFWALSLLIKDEYAAVGVPMLPVVRGERATVIQITAYAILTALISTLPLVMNELGWIYLACAGALNLLLVVRSWQLMQSPNRDQAVRLFKYSMVYLALVFVVIAADRMVHGGPADLRQQGPVAQISKLLTLMTPADQQKGNPDAAAL